MSFQDDVSKVFASAKNLHSACAQLPKGDDYEYNSAFRGFRKVTQDCSASCLKSAELVVRQYVSEKQFPKSGFSSTDKVGLQRAVVDSIDNLLENVDQMLDHATGEKMNASEQEKVSFGSAPARFNNDAAVVVRPQLDFDPPVDNSAAPFRPSVRDAHGNFTVGDAGVHPLSDKIKAIQFSDSQLVTRSEVPPLELDKTPFKYVDTVEALGALVEVLSGSTEIAVDLEHHSKHSFQGFTCLMQISTRSEDFIIDTLKLRSNMWRLGSVFSNSKITKVLHGAREDVKWLQKDFGLYVANMFDTGIAMQVLHMPHSLAFTVNHFCQITLEKKYQLADWRIRPLPADFLHYARQDTHYLLYIYDRLKSLLNNTENKVLGNLVLHTLNESRQLSLTVYEKPAIDPKNSFADAMGRSLSGLRDGQRELARVLFNWRFETAREADDSPPAVLPTAAILQLAIAAPTTPSRVLKCVSPVSVAVRRRLNELVELIKEHGTENFAADEGQELDSETQRHIVFTPYTGTLPSVGQPGAALSLQCGQYQKTTPESQWMAALRRDGVKRVAVESMSAVQLPTTALPSKPQEIANHTEEDTAVIEHNAEKEADHSEKAPATPANYTSLAEEYGLGRKTRKQLKPLGKRKRE